MFPPFNVLMFAPASTVEAAATEAASAAAASAKKPAAANKSKQSGGDDKEMSIAPAPKQAFGSAAAAAAGASASGSGSGSGSGGGMRLPFLPLVASGTLQSVDPKKCIIKRIVLSGYPISVHKRMAVIRYMFYRAEDIKWFKPVEVWTKNGLTGHVREPRGTKGYMKCNFNDFIKQNDTVCMSLYKRQFPKWDPNAFNTPH